MSGTAIISTRRVQEGTSMHGPRPRMQYWIAQRMTSEVGLRGKPVHPHCVHRHYTRETAQKCAEAIERRVNRRRLRGRRAEVWRPIEIVMVPVGGRLPDGRLVR